MKSDYRVTQISAGTCAVHAYYDLCPESPDGARVVYLALSEWPYGCAREQIRIPGEVKAASRDGKDHQTIGAVSEINAHVGVWQQWVGDEDVAYWTPGEMGAQTVVFSLRSGDRRQVPGGLRMFSPANRTGLTSSRTTSAGLVGFRGNKEAVYLMDLDRAEIRPLFTRAEAIAVHPLRERFSDVSRLYFKHTKWAPDGTKFLVGFMGREPGATSNMCTSLFLANADGSRLRYFSEYGHHPFWAPDSSYVYYCDHAEDGGWNLAARPVDGPDARILRKNLSGHPCMSPDGTRVVTNTGSPEHKKGEESITLYDLSTGKQEILVTMKKPENTRASQSHPVWSRDGRRIYFNSADSGVPHLYAIDL